MGDMGEVGNEGPYFHEEAGQWAKAQGIENLYTLGEQSLIASSGFGSGLHFNDVDKLNAAVLAQLPHVSSVLVKGSRFMKMERVVQVIIAHELAQTQEHKEAQHAA